MLVAIIFLPLVNGHLCDVNLYSPNVGVSLPDGHAMRSLIVSDSNSDLNFPSTHCLIQIVNDTEIEPMAFLKTFDKLRVMKKILFLRGNSSSLLRKYIEESRWTFDAILDYSNGTIEEKCTLGWIFRSIKSSLKSSCNSRPYWKESRPLFMNAFGIPPFFHRDTMTGVDLEVRQTQKNQRFLTTLACVPGRLKTYHIGIWYI